MAFKHFIGDKFPAHVEDLINVRYFFQVTVYVDATYAEEFSEVCSKLLKSLPYDSPGQIFVAFEKPEHVPASGKFSNVLKFTIKEVSVKCSSYYWILV